MERLIAQPNFIKRGLAVVGLTLGALVGTACLPHELKAAQDFCASRTDTDMPTCMRTLATLSRGMSLEASRRVDEINQTMAPTDKQLADLRNCESHGIYNNVSGSGKYRGAYQFSQETWNNTMGGAAHLPEFVGTDPKDAQPVVQDAAARALYTAAGRGQWPVCGPRNLPVS